MKSISIKNYIKIKYYSKFWNLIKMAKDVFFKFFKQIFSKKLSLCYILELVYIVVTYEVMRGG